MEKYKRYTKQLYKFSSKLIRDVSKSKTKFKNIYETSHKIIYEDDSRRTIELNTCEMILKYNDIAVYYRENLIQLCANKISYIHDVVYIPNNQEFSFFSLTSECELFQLSTIVDTKLLQFEDISALNNIRDYFEIKFLSNNT